MLKIEKGEVDIAGGGIEIMEEWCKLSDALFGVIAKGMNADKNSIKNDCIKFLIKALEDKEEEN